jgi:FlaA1/EpsC-like NDP-sugar epimerase
MSSRVRSALILGCDAALAVGSLFAVYALRFEGIPAERRSPLAVEVILLLIAARLGANLLFRLDRWSFRFSGLPDGARIGMAGLFGTGLFTLGLDLAQTDHQPRSVLVSELLLTTLLMAAVRFGPRLVWTYRADLWRSRRPGAARTVILGAGISEENLLRDLRHAPRPPQVLGFIDDDPRRWGDVVGGKTVLGASSDLPKMAERFGVEQVVIAVPQLSARRLREILAACAGLKLRFKVLPRSYHGLDEPSAAMLTDLQPSDLLERDEIALADSAPHFTADHTALVAGAAGSIGRELCVQLLNAGCPRLVLLDIDENGLYVLQQRFERQYPDQTLIVEVASIRDVGRIREIFLRHRPRDVFHAAARKHVPLMESCPGEAIKTNVVGTRILDEAAEETGVSRFVFMSTDKAVHPTSVMGASKRLGEILMRWMNARSETFFSVVRFGNVLDSAGSVVPLFREQIAAGGPVRVTHPEVRRYFMTISEAVALVLRAAYGANGELCVLEMGKPIRILELARGMISMSGQVPDVDIKIEIVGLRPGEKLSERLLADDERVDHHIEEKIAVVEGPPPPANLPAVLTELAAAAMREDGAEIRQLLRSVVSDYRSPVASRKPPRAAETAAMLPS